MAWARDFIAALTSGAAHRYDLQPVQLGNVPGDYGYRATSFAGEGDPILADAGVRVTGPTLDPVTCSSTLGEIEIDLAGDPSRLIQAVTRGTVMRLRLGLQVGGRWAWEVIAYGQVQQLVRRSRTSATLRLRDLLSALRCRPTVTAGQLGIFYGYTYATTLTADYTPGDASISVASTTGFEMDSGAGAVLVTPSSGDPFVLRWSSKTATAFTLSGAGSDQHGTTRTAASSGDAVQSLLLVEDHPIDIARKILVSVGSGGSTYDTLPVGWGLTLNPAWIDHDDCDLYLDASEPSMVWEVMSDALIEDPWSWLSGVLAAGGFYLTMRQGMLTVRAQLPVGRRTSPIPSAGVVRLVLPWTEIEGMEVELWDQDAAEEAVNVTAYGATSNASAGTEAPATLPAISRAEYDLRALLFTDEAAGLSSIVDRVYEARQRIPERYVLDCAGLRCAQLAPGDQILITGVEWIGGRFSDTRDGLIEAFALVVQVSPDYGAGRVRLVALGYPQDDQVWP